MHFMMANMTSVGRRPRYDVPSFQRIFFVVNSSRSSFNRSFRRLFDVDVWFTPSLVTDDSTALFVVFNGRVRFDCRVADPDPHAYPSSVSSFPESSASPFYEKQTFPI